jgi:hypothetical protein
MHQRVPEMDADLGYAMVASLMHAVAGLALDMGLVIPDSCPGGFVFANLWPN